MIKVHEEHTISSSISCRRTISIARQEEGHAHFYFLYGRHDCHVLYLEKESHAEAIATVTL
jgi:hypothetical protein